MYIIEVEYYPDSTTIRAISDDLVTLREDAYTGFTDDQIDEVVEEWRGQLGYNACAEIITSDFRGAQPIKQLQHTRRTSSFQHILGAFSRKENAS